MRCDNCGEQPYTSVTVEAPDEAAPIQKAVEESPSCPTVAAATLNPAGLSQTFDPVNGGADTNPKLLRRPIARHPAGLDRRGHRSRRSIE
jgi:hypothetical protein